MPQDATIKSRLKRLRRIIFRFTRQSVNTIKAISVSLEILTVVASFVALADMTVYFGFDHNAVSLKWLLYVLHGIQIVFIANATFNLLKVLCKADKGHKAIQLIADSIILLSLLPLAYPQPTAPWIPALNDIIYSKITLFALLSSYSILSICTAIMKTLNKRTNPTIIMAVSFLFLIFTGALMLMMPKCHVGELSFTDSLFVSTSAVCITGLTTVDISQTFTSYGIIIIGFLVQTGGLGIMTFTSFFALFFSGNTSIYSQLMIKDMIYTRSINALLPTLLYILTFTLTIEIIGAAVIYSNIHDLLGNTVRQDILFSIFHSMNAFCNSGFSNIEGGLSNPALLHSNQHLYFTLSVLIFAGGVGFPVLANFKDAIMFHFKRLAARLSGRKVQHQLSHLYNMNTKVALITTTIILIISMILFLVFESRNTLSGMTPGQKIIQALFNSLSPRSSGFTSVNPAGFLNITIVLMIILMWIGGASQSTAGGIKVNTFATMLLNLKAIITGKRRVTVFSRTISVGSLRRANAIIAVSIISFSAYTMTLLALEPSLPAKSLIYESASALFTVGSSLGVTPLLGTPAKYLLCSAMFLGRVGLLSLMAGLFAKERAAEPIYPTDNIIIN